MQKICGVCTQSFHPQDTILKVQFMVCTVCDSLTIVPNSISGMVCLFCSSHTLERITHTADLDVILASLELPTPCPECAYQWSNPFAYVQYMLESGFLLTRCDCGRVSLHTPSSTITTETKLLHAELWDGSAFRKALDTHDCEACLPNKNSENQQKHVSGLDEEQVFRH